MGRDYPRLTRIDADHRRMMTTSEPFAQVPDGWNYGSRARGNDEGACVNDGLGDTFKGSIFSMLLTFTGSKSTGNVAYTISLYADLQNTEL
jgi:hypothetical protein